MANSSILYICERRRGGEASQTSRGPK